jgi:hypothetical protein
MKVVVFHPHGTLGWDLTAALLSAGHDVRLAGVDAGTTLPVGARSLGATSEPGSADVAVTVVGGLGASGEATGPRAMDDLVGATRCGAANLLVVALHEPALVEEVLAGQAAAWTLQASTTPHVDLHLALARRCTGGILRVPVAQVLQPVATSVVTGRVVALVRAGPLGRVPDVGGPAVATVGELAAAWARRRGGEISVEPCPPGCGCWEASVVSPGRRTGHLTWERWLDARSDVELAEPGGEPAGAEPVCAGAGVGEER